ncbi:MAG: thiamine diphosphokinase [Maritimibacter sp.]
MTEHFARFETNVTLLGGGALSPETVSELLKVAPNLVACDGGAGAALALGLMPKLVLGDMDSIAAEDRARLDPAIIHEISEQDSTDFDKAIRNLETPLILGAGFMGRRADHELACYNVLVRRAESRVILVGEHDVCFHVADNIRLRVTPGLRVSLFPMAEVEVRSSGLEYPLDPLVLAPWARVGTSNRAVSEDVEISVSGPGLLVLLPRSALSAAIEAVSSSAR